MEMNLQNKPLANRSLSFAAGILFVCLSIVIMGYGAAVAVPEKILLPLMQLSPTLALSLTSFVTIGLPLTLTFYLLAIIFRQLFNMVNSSFLIAPFILFMVYGLATIALNNDAMWYNLALTLAKLLPVLLCAIFLARRNKSSNKT
ncbi:MULTISPECIES: hypothetical protein [unclassified Alteromonas]|uniref:hypothetical protein n=1 Tax=unclassified Alteromonas TaxID=2614992 RepID=UPI00050963E2|nr:MULTISPECIES: hypothetical protein [unclassified Alteromonas]